jgi:hypothetical protein
MIWVGAEYRFASTFSYRIPYFSSSYAACSPVPGPATVKLALVSSIISRRGDVEEGQHLFESIKMSRVALEMPRAIAIFKSFMKRLKQKRGGRGFERTFGVREYALFDGPLGICVEVREDVRERLLEALRWIRSLGTSDSICSCVDARAREPKWARCPSLYQGTVLQSKKEGVIFMLTDLAEGASFEKINPFSGAKMNPKEDLVLKPYLFPMRIEKKESNLTLYQLIVG